MFARPPAALLVHVKSTDERVTSEALLSLRISANGTSYPIARTIAYI